MTARHADRYRVLEIRLTGTWPDDSYREAGRELREALDRAVRANALLNLYWSAMRVERICSGSAAESQTRFLGRKVRPRDHHALESSFRVSRPPGASREPDVGRLLRAEFPRVPLARD